MKLRKYKKKKFSSYISFGIMIIILSLILSFIIINYFSIRCNDILLPIAESKTRKVVTMIINSACDEKMILDNLYEINKNNDDEIEMITYNSFEVTKLTNIITQNIQNKFDMLENKNTLNSEDFIIEEIPFGVVFKNSFLRNIGPRIKLRIDRVGDVLTELQTEVKPYGINNALVEVRVLVDANVRVVLPFVSKEIRITNVIPISINIVNGSIPEAYISSYK